MDIVTFSFDIVQVNSRKDSATISAWGGHALVH